MKTSLSTTAAVQQPLLLLKQQHSRGGDGGGGGGASLEAAAVMSAVCTWYVCVSKIIGRTRELASACDRKKKMAQLFRRTSQIQS